MDFAREGEPFDLYLMRQHHWLPDQIASLPNRMVLELLAAERLAQERRARG